MTDDLIEKLEDAAEAYPEDVFGKTTDEDRRDHGDVVQRAAATMGRHMAPLLREAVTALEAAREDAWQPIETAPRDGRQMILLLTPSRFPQVAFSNSWWTSGFSVECKPTHWRRIEPLPAIDAAREARNG